MRAVLSSGKRRRRKRSSVNPRAAKERLLHGNRPLTVQERGKRGPSVFFYGFLFLTEEL